MSLASLLNLGKQQSEAPAEVQAAQELAKIKGEDKTWEKEEEPIPGIEDFVPVQQSQEELLMAQELAKTQSKVLEEEAARRRPEEEAAQKKAIDDAAKHAAALAKQRKEAAANNPFSTGGNEFQKGAFVCDTHHGVSKPIGAVSTLGTTISRPTPQLSITNSSSWTGGGALGAFKGGLAAGAATAAWAMSPMGWGGAADSWGKAGTWGKGCWGKDGGDDAYGPYGGGCCPGKGPSFAKGGCPAGYDDWFGADSAAWYGADSWTGAGDWGCGASAGCGAYGTGASSKGSSAGLDSAGAPGKGFSAAGFDSAGVTAGKGLGDGWFGTSPAGCGSAWAGGW